MRTLCLPLTPTLPGRGRLALRKAGHNQRETNVKGVAALERNKQKSGRGEQRRRALTDPRLCPELEKPIAPFLGVFQAPRWRASEQTE